MVRYCSEPTMLQYCVGLERRSPSEIDSLQEEDIRDDIGLARGP